MISEFKVGMQVRVITRDETDHFGDVGRIRNEYDRQPRRRFEVDFGDELEEFEADEIELAPVTAPSAETTTEALRDQVEAGTRELRRYVDGNGFKWCEDESTVFNVTTALGLMGGTIDALQTELADAQAALKSCINADLTGFWSAEEVAKRYFEETK